MGPVDMQSYELCCDMIDVAIDISSIYGLREVVEGEPFDSCSSSTIHLNNSTVLYLREVNRFLAIVCILKEDNFHRKGLIDYNFLCLRQAISRVFQVRAKRRRQTAGSGTGDVVGWGTELRWRNEKSTICQMMLFLPAFSQ